MAALGTAVLHGAVALDSTGNGLLKGAFRFRQVAVRATDSNTGSPTQVTAAYGVINFDGGGNFTVTGTFIDNTVSRGAAQNLSATGTYVIGSNGTGYVANPLDPTNNANLIYGAAAQGLFAGSATEGTLNDVFVAILPGTTAPTNSSFNTAYWAGLLDFTNASDAAAKNALFKLSPNGQGGFGAIALTGQAANQSAASISQTVNGATYNFATDGTATLTIPTPSGVTAANALFTGTKTMFVSGDGSVVVGWTPAGYDIFFGVKALSSAASNNMFSGLYYSAALEDIAGAGGVDSYYGSVSADGAGNEILHERVSLPKFNPYDYVTDNATQFNPDGTTSGVDFNGYLYGFGNSGQTFVGVGSGGLYSLLIGVHSANFTPSGVYLYPTGVVNAASYAPITTSLAPGELLTLFGSNLAKSTLTTQGGQPFPTTLNGVQVMINGIAAPIYYVSSGQISAIVPYNISSASSFLVQIQVINNGTPSNTVTLYSTDAIPGVFTQSQNGLGFAAALHAADGSLVSKDNPAKPGEYLEVFLTGLGTVTPPITDGALGPSSTLSYADVYNAKNLAVFFNDYANNMVFQQGTVNFAGLAPGLAGLYQVNVQVPNTVGPSNVYLELVTDFADVNLAQVPVATAANQAAAPRARRQGSLRRPHGVIATPERRSRQ